MNKRAQIPDWCLQRPKSFLQKLVDLIGAPLRMVLLPDGTCERFHLTSLRGERLAVVLPEVQGRLLDVGAGDNQLVALYKKFDSPAEPEPSVGVDVVDWGSEYILVKRSDDLPFSDASFDTVTFVACLNHISERAGALIEAFRLLRPNGRVVVTMIGPLIGKVGHALWWYSEDKHRDVDEHEEMGMSPASVIGLFAGRRFHKHPTDFVCLRAESSIRG
jgi:SAM-dependent methyltransferase